MRRPQDNDDVVVWFSCGAASAVAAKLTLQHYGHRCNVRIVNTPVVEEDEDNRRFLADVERWLGVGIDIATNSKWPSNSAKDVWEKRKYMAGVAGAPCTSELKRGARYKYTDKNPHDMFVLGYTFDEKQRAERFLLTEADNMYPILIDHGLSKPDCFQIIELAGIKLPRAYDHFDNANCTGCPKANSQFYWATVRKFYSKVFADRAKQSRELGARLVKIGNKRIFLDELPADIEPRKVKSKYECGLFCEEPLPRQRKT